MKTIAMVSGGLDSAVLLSMLREYGDELAALSFNYGQRHRRELAHAKALCDFLGVEWRMVDMASIAPLLAGSSQTSEGIPVPHGHYAEESMKLTVVPNRNMIMLSIAAALAISLRYDRVAYAAHAGDHAIYPDCRPDFVQRIGEAIAIADWHSVGLHTPFINKTKAEIVSIGQAVGVDFSGTWSCYEGLDVHCGRCGTCTERKEAFALAGVPDPTTYKQ